MAGCGCAQPGPMVAAGLGASALLIRSIGTSNNRVAHTGNISSTEPGERVPSAAISNPDADLLEALLAWPNGIRGTIAGLRLRGHEPFAQRNRRKLTATEQRPICDGRWPPRFLGSGHRGA